MNISSIVSIIYLVDFYKRKTGGILHTNVDDLIELSSYFVNTYAVLHNKSRCRLLYEFHPFNQLS